jgi:hypothetical protein
MYSYNISKRREIVTKTDRENLITLANTLRTAQLQANAVEATAPQPGVYGDIGKPLFDVLVLLTGDESSAFEVTDMLVDSGEDVTYCMTYLYSRAVRSALRYAV